MSYIWEMQELAVGYCSSRVVVSGCSSLLICSVVMVAVGLGAGELLCLQPWHELSLFHSWFSTGEKRVQLVAVTSPVSLKDGVEQKCLCSFAFCDGSKE